MQSEPNPNICSDNCRDSRRLYVGVHDTSDQNPHVFVDNQELPVCEWEPFCLAYNKDAAHHRMLRESHVLG